MTEEEAAEQRSKIARIFDDPEYLEIRRKAMEGAWEDALKNPWTKPFRWIDPSAKEPEERK